MQKRCSCCGAIKPVSEFNKGQRRCRPCDHEYLRAWRAKNPERSNGISRAYRERCLANDPIGYRRKAADSTLRYVAENLQLARARTKRWKLENRARVAWRNMTERCSNARFTEYCGRGIKVCDRWLVFENFLADMGEPPTGMSLDRIDNDKGYDLSNCRWATMGQQGRNKRNTIMLTHEEKIKSLADWADDLGVTQATLYHRIVRAGWSVGRALTEPVAIKRQV